MDSPQFFRVTKQHRTGTLAGTVTVEITTIDYRAGQTIRSVCGGNFRVYAVVPVCQHGREGACFNDLSDAERSAHSNLDEAAYRWGCDRFNELAALRFAATYADSFYATPAAGRPAYDTALCDLMAKDTTWAELLAR
jgi:hypothetical protein